MKFKINLIFLIKPFCNMTKDKNVNILRTKKAFEVKKKAFFIIFKGTSVVKNSLRPESLPLRNTRLLELSKCRTKTYGLNTTLFKGALLWNKLSNHFMEAKSLTNFKNKIREWAGR